MEKYRKRTDYYITYRIVEPGERVHNFLENADYETDLDHCVVLTGTVGEEWVVTKEKLRKSYVVGDADLEIGESGKVCPKGDDNVIFGEVAQETTEVKTSWGTTLTAKPGDIIAYNGNSGQPDENDRWVINGQVFKTTYEKC